MSGGKSRAEHLALDKLLIEGSTRLSGQVTISGAKNAALPILAGTLLATEQVVIGNVPHLQDVTTMLSLLQMLGVQVTVDDCVGVGIDASTVNSYEAPYDLCSVHCWRDLAKRMFRFRVVALSVHAQSICILRAWKRWALTLSSITDS